MRELITPQEMAERLSVEYGTFRRTNWRNYPHIFIGKGRTLRSVRFMWESDLSHLPDSQAGAVRHKSAIDAYNLGYKFGREISS